MKKIVKGILKGFNYLILLVMLFLTIEFMAYYTTAEYCGDTKIAAYEYAETMVKTKYLDPVDNWLKEQIKEQEVKEYLIPNWNINWNSMGREP